jgi:hypothetical protein
MPSLQQLHPNAEPLWQEISTIGKDAVRRVEQMGKAATPTQQACSTLADTTLCFAQAALMLAEKDSFVPAEALLTVAAAIWTATRCGR